MRTVITKQWTKLSIEDYGDGPVPLVFVHDTATDHTEARLMAAAVGTGFRVIAPDRRGRGQSEDEAHHGLAREAESDILAVVNDCASPVVVVGHGYGAALCVRMAPLAQTPIRALVLVDGGVVAAGADGEGHGDLLATAGKLNRHLAAGEHEDVVAQFLTEVSGLRPDDLQTVRASDSWAGWIGTSGTVPREVRALAGATLSPGQARGVRSPTLLIQSSGAADWVNEGFDQALALLPGAQLHKLDGHPLVLFNRDPAALAVVVTEFAEAAANIR